MFNFVNAALIGMEGLPSPKPELPAAANRSYHHVLELGYGFWGRGRAWWLNHWWCHDRD